MKNAPEPTTGNPGIWFRLPRPSLLAVAQRCSAARVRYAAANTAAPLPPARRCARASFATDGSAGNQIPSSFFVLPKTETRS
jgi:hypothetical protein